MEVSTARSLDTSPTSAAQNHVTAKLAATTSTGSMGDWPPPLEHLIRQLSGTGMSPLGLI